MGRDTHAEARRPDTTITSDSERVAVELSSRRTGMSFQRTRMSADRTLMAMIRTSLSLIAFGFTIFQFFRTLAETNVLESGSGAARQFGLALVCLGVALTVLGIIYHAQFMYGLRVERRRMTEEGLIHGQSHFPVSLTLLTAIALLLIGIAAIVSMIFNVAVFG